jgi:gluconate 2-dehydrogenase gamma chain
MEPSAESVTRAAISRREAIRRTALLAGVALSPAWLGIVGRARAAAQTQYLSPAHIGVAGAIADRILPRTDTPGAIDVGVPAFIDLLYGEFMTPAERQLLTTGLDAVEAEGKAAGAASFSVLAVDGQDTVLRGIARAEEGQPQGFFRLIRSATILGYFTSEQVGRNVLHYEPVPGRYEACIPIDQVGRRNWTT